MQYIEMHINFACKTMQSRTLIRSSGVQKCTVVIYQVAFILHTKNATHKFLVLTMWRQFDWQRNCEFIKPNWIYAFSARLVRFSRIKAPAFCGTHKKTYRWASHICAQEYIYNMRHLHPTHTIKTHTHKKKVTHWRPNSVARARRVNWFCGLTRVDYAASMNVSMISQRDTKALPHKVMERPRPRIHTTQTWKLNVIVNYGQHYITINTKGLCLILI